MTPQQDQHSTGLQTITLSAIAIAIAEDFNPRGDVEDSGLDELAHSIERRGIIVPIVVAPAGEGEYRLIDGERRMRAAMKLGLVEIPAVVRETDERTLGLEDAVVANQARRALNPIEEAQAFKRLIDAGLTRRGVAHELGVSPRLVTDRLAMLELPQQLWEHLADGRIPPSAVKTLRELGAIHPELPALVVRRVEHEPEDPWEESATWPEVVERPLNVVLGYGYEDDLPAGVYEVPAVYALERFALGADADEALEELARLGISREHVQVRFGSEELEAARQLGVAHTDPKGYVGLIVGQDVADQLAGDYLRRLAETQRDSAKAVARIGAHVNAHDPSAPAGGEGGEEQRKEQRRREREAEAERKRAASAYNADLGVAVLKAFAKVRVDERVAKVLASLDLQGELAALAMRGARYGFPGWPVETTTKGGKPKVEYLGAGDAAAKARNFLGIASRTGEIAGRCVALAVMARYAKEECVAQSSRSFYDLRLASWSDTGLPWEREALALLEELAEERLPEHLSAHVREQREKLAEEREEREREQAAVRTEVAELLERLPELGVEERAAAIANVGERYGRWRPELAKLQAAAAELEREADHHAAGPAAGGEADGALESGDDRDEK